MTFDNGQSVDSYTVQGDNIRDLKVVGLPHELQKGRKNQGYTQDEVVFSASETVQPGNNSKVKAKKSGKKSVYFNDGDVTWDDVSSIKQSEEFDFAQSTADFDKRRALEEFEVNDNVDSENRLVGHNKLKTKYSHDENVLQNKSDNWEDTSSVLSDEAGAITITNRENKKASAQLLAMIQTQPANARRSPSLETRGYQLQSMAKEQLPLATPLQIIEVERLCSENFKLSQQLITENASRGIASLVVKMLGGSSRIAQSNHNLPPLVLLLVGNNRSGARALATGRQLANHGLRVIAYTLTDFTNTEDLDANVQEQYEMLEFVGGKSVCMMTELSKFMSSLETPLEFVVDGLQGYDTSLGDLWGSELENATSVISWVNGQGVNVLSLDIPSGIDAGSGLLCGISPIEAKFVASCTLPVNGLLLAYSNQVVQKGEISHYLVDVGIPRKVFKQGKLRKFDRSWFAGDFVTGLDVVEK